MDDEENPYEGFSELLSDQWQNGRELGILERSKEFNIKRALS